MPNDTTALEDAFLKGVPGIDDDNAAATTTNTPANDGGNTNDDASPTTTKPTEKAGDAEGKAATSSEPKATPAGTSREETRAGGNKGTAADGKAPAATADKAVGDSITDKRGERLRVDELGNLVNATTGKIVAKAGAERRYYENATRAQQQLEVERRRFAESNQRYQAMETELNAYKNFANSPAKLGLSPQDAAFGLELVAKYKANPIETLKYILTEMQAAGHDVSSVLGAGAGAGINTAAISKMIEQKLAPIMQQHQQQQDNAAQNAAVEREYNEFMATHEYAHVHEETLARLLAQNDELTPKEAYLRLENWALRNGLDFSKPLAPQVEAKNAAPAGAPPNTTTPTSAKPVHPGRGDPTTLTSDKSVASVTTSYSDIIKETMREHGMNVA